MGSPLERRKTRADGLQSMAAAMTEVSFTEIPSTPAKIALASATNVELVGKLAALVRVVKSNATVILF
jgi:hypothetical protein